METEPPPKNHDDHPSTSDSLGYFHLRLLGPAAPLLLRSGRLYFFCFSRRRGPCLRLLSSPTRRRGDLLLSTSGCVLRLTHHFSSANAVLVNGRHVHASPRAVAPGMDLLWRNLSLAKWVTAAGSCVEALVLRAESLRKRLRAISESHDPLSFLRDSHCLENGSVDVGLKKAREEDGLLCLDNPISPVPEKNLPREDCNLDQDNLEHHSDVAKDDIVELTQGGKGCSNDNADQKGCSNGIVWSSITARVATWMGAHSS